LALPGQILRAEFCLKIRDEYRKSGTLEKFGKPSPHASQAAYDSDFWAADIRIEICRYLRFHNF
jgi:hypothetical protein